MLRAADGRGRICRNHLADNEPIEQHAHGGELVFDGRRRGLRLQLLYIGGDVVRPDRGKREAAPFAPGEKPGARAGIGAECVRVADIGGEELDVAPAGLVAEVGDQRTLSCVRFRPARRRERANDPADQCRPLRLRRPDPEPACLALRLASHRISPARRLIEPAPELLAG
jgi:hypothetical protein